MSAFCKVSCAPADAPPLQAARELYGGQFYWNYYEQPRAAEAELSADIRSTLRRILYHLSGDNPARSCPAGSKSTTSTSSPPRSPSPDSKA